MAFEQPGTIRGEYPADIDMSNAAVWQFAPVWLAPANNVTNVTLPPANMALVAQGALTTPAFGILQGPTFQGNPGCVVQTGVSKCLVAATVTAGQAIQLVAGGCQPASSGNPIDGYAEEGGPAGAIISVSLKQNGKA